MSSELEPQRGVPLHTGPPPGMVFPSTPVLESRSYSASLSYVGITRRTSAWVRRVGAGSVPAAMAAWSAAVFFLLTMYVVILMWYVVIFGLFGVFVFPYRLVRRSQRKNMQIQEQQLATMQAALASQWNGARGEPPAR